MYCIHVNCKYIRIQKFSRVN